MYYGCAAVCVWKYAAATAAEVEHEGPMLTHSRRDFLKASSAVALTAAATQSSFLHATPFGLPIGIQVYSVHEQAAKDFAGTLAMLASCGYQEVEAAGFYNHSAAEVNKALKDAGLKCPSAHYGFPQVTTQLDQIIAFGHEIGLKYIVCSTPGYKDPERVKALPRAQQRDAFILDDWKFNAEKFNAIGEKVKAAGMNFAYHNHVNEFHADAAGNVPFDVLLKETDPAKVSFEMDCGWVLVGGAKPVDYLKRYPTRFCMLHVKDFVSDKPNADGKPPEPTELGKGVMDYHPIFQAAAKGQIKHVFVEQEGYDMPVEQSLKMDADYIKKFSA
jgi:sugar phosphate isomerase/epimerase